MNWSGTLLGMMKPTVLAERERLVYCEGTLQNAPVPLERKRFNDSNETLISGGGGQG